MSATQLEIELPPQFDAAHEHAVVDYLAGRLAGRDAWVRAFATFDLLDRSILVIGNQRLTFRAVYREVVDLPLADAYIDELLALRDVRAESPGVWARYARHIQSRSWLSLNCDTVPGDLTTLAQQLPAPVAVTHHGHQLIVLDYNEWKRRVLRLQGGTI